MEVQVPFIQYLFPKARILPILTPPAEQAIHLGEIVGSIISSDDERKIVCLGSTDLTHYGPRYGFTPMGAGKDALKWAIEVNDKQFIDYSLKMQPDKMLESANENYNACGAGAAAAAVAVAKYLGKNKRHSARPYQQQRDNASQNGRNQPGIRRLRRDVF